MKTRLSWISVLVWLSSSCNHIRDVQPQQTLPQSAINAVRTQFPQATNLVFKPLEKNRIWQVEFTQTSDLFKGAVSDSSLLAMYRQTNAVPDSIRTLIEATSARGGEFPGDFKQQVAFAKGDFRYGVYLADYQWRGNSYSLAYTDFRIAGLSTGGTYTYRTLSLTNPISFLYASGDETVLPQKVRQFLQQQELTAAAAPYAEQTITVQVTGEGKQTYRVSARKRAGGSFACTLVFDQAGDYVYATSIPTSDGTTGIDGATRTTSNQLSQLPPAIRNRIETSSDYQGFSFDHAEVINLYGRQTTVVHLTNAQKETWQLYYNAEGIQLSQSLTFPIR